MEGQGELGLPRPGREPQRVWGLQWVAASGAGAVCLWGLLWKWALSLRNLLPTWQGSRLEAWGCPGIQLGSDCTGRTPQPHPAPQGTVRAGRRDASREQDRDHGTGSANPRRLFSLKVSYQTVVWVSS